MNRVVHYILLFDILVICSATHQPSLNWNVFFENKKLTIISSKSDLLELNQDFQIKIQIFDNIVLNSIKCYYKPRPSTVFVEETNLTRRNNYYIVKGNKTDTSMKTKWTCTIIYNNSMSTTEELDVRFKISNTTEEKCHVYVNDVKIKPNPASGHDRQITAKGEHWYREGELVKVTCQKLTSIAMAISYPYYNDYNEKEDLTTQLANVTEITIYLKLTQKQNEHYFTCNVTTKTYPSNQYYTVHLYFYMKQNSEPDNIQFNVNGMSLAQINKNGTITYMYEYYPGEVIKITGSTTQMNNKWYCTPALDENDKQLEPITYQHKSIDLTVIMNAYESKSFDCIVGYNDTALFKLEPKSTKDAMPMTGFSLSNTLYAYGKDDKNYFIKYKNSGNKQMPLTCSSKDYKCSLSEDGVKYPGNNYTYEPSNKTSSEVKCTCAENSKTYTTTAVILNDESEAVTESTSLGATTDIGGDMITEQGGLEVPEEKDKSPNGTIEKDASEKASGSNTENNDKEDTGFNPSLLIGIVGVAVVIVTVAIIISIIVGIHKRKRRLQYETQQQTDINYENLPEHNEGPMAMPSQWDNYSQPLHSEDTYTYAEPYVAKNINDMYSKPIPKGQRQKPTETLYAEVGGEPNYAAVGSESGYSGIGSEASYAMIENKSTYATVGSELNYATVAPKVAKKPNVDYANLNRTDPNYSEIQPKKLPTPQVLPRLPGNENYAQVLPKSMRNGDTYGNVFDNQPYVNTLAKRDYTEPAYCEVNTKKTLKKK